MGTTGPGAWLDREWPNKIVQRAAQANLVKLANAAVEERHLFVWVPWSDLAGQAAFSSVQGLPENPPDLPQAIDAVWLAPWQPGPTVPTTVLWRGAVNEGWSSELVRYVDARFT